MNRDGLVTISDVWLATKFVWLLPSKFVALVLSQFPSVVTFLEMDCSFGEGAGGAIFSLIVWLILIVIVAIEAS